MSEIPYTQKELKNIGSEVPDRGILCRRCGVHIPQFAELSDADARRIREKCQGQPFLATCELQAATGCPQHWAKIWVEHRGFPGGWEKVPVCNSSHRLAVKAYDIDQILSTPNPAVAVSRLWSALQTANDNHNKAEVNFLVAFECWLGVHAEGLSGWLFNNPDIVPVVVDARNGFDGIGALDHARVMQQVEQVFSSCAASTASEDFSQILGLPETKEKLSILESAFDAASAQADMEELLRAYVVQHLDKFK